MQYRKVLILAIMISAMVWAGGCSSEQEQPQTKSQTQQQGQIAEQGAAEQGAGQVPLMQRCEKRFAELDTNNDGYVDMQEFMAIPHRRGDAEQVFKERDADDDGRLTIEEFCRAAGTEGMGKGRQ